MSGDAIAEALDGGGLSLALFLRFDFASGPFHVWSGNGDIELAGATWKGAGELARVGELEQLINGAADRLTIEVSGVTAEAQGAVLGEVAEVNGREVEIGFVLFDAARLPISGLQALDIGIMDRVSLALEPSEGAELAVRQVALDVGSPMAARSTAGLAFYSDVDQQLRHPGDRGCERTTTQVTLTWPDF